MKKILIVLAISLILGSALPAKAATVNFSTSGGGNVNYGQAINVTVYANSSDAFNAVDVVVTYSNLNFVSSSIAGGWTGIAGPSNNGGSVSFSGALLGSSATGSRAVLNLSFTAPSSTGSATISSSGTIALADGNGTAVSGGGNIVTYTILAPAQPTATPSNPNPNPTPTTPVEPAPKSVNLTSKTHPDQSKWYYVTTAEFEWNKEDKVTGFSYVLSQNPDENPDDTVEGDLTSTSISNIPEGVSYFHIKAKNNVGWGPVVHYKLSIDSTEPNPFAILFEENADKTKYIVYFATNDLLSGMSRFNSLLDGNSIGTITSPLEVNKDAKEIEIIAFDNANNSRSRKLSFVNEEPTSSTNDISTNNTKDNSNNSILIIFLTVFAVVILELIIWLTFKLLKRHKSSKVLIIEGEQK